MVLGSTELAIARLQQLRESLESFSAPNAFRKKALGQYFTRLPLARILAALSAERMAEVKLAYQVKDASILTDDVFRALSCESVSKQYDLVIANPPYVRYQRIAMAGSGVATQHRALQQALRDASARLLPDTERQVWDALMGAYP